MFCHEYKSIFIGMFRIKVGDSSLPDENGQWLFAQLTIQAGSDPWFSKTVAQQTKNRQYRPPPGQPNRNHRWRAPRHDKQPTPLDLSVRDPAAAHRKLRRRTQQRSQPLFEEQQNLGQILPQKTVTSYRPRANITERQITKIFTGRLVTLFSSND